MRHFNILMFIDKLIRLFVNLLIYQLRKHGREPIELNIATAHMVEPPELMAPPVFLNVALWKWPLGLLRLL